MLLLFSKIRDKELYFYCLLSISYEEYFGTLFYARVFPCERRTASSFDCAPTVFEKHFKKSHFSNCELRCRKDVFFCKKIAVEPGSLCDQHQDQDKNEEKDTWVEMAS